MSTPISLAQAREVMRAVWTEAPRIPVMLWGPSGVGKSAVVEALARDPIPTVAARLKTGQAPGFRVLRAHALNPCDIQGVLVADHKSGTAQWLPLGLLPDPSRGDPAGGYLFLDEVNLAPPSIQGELMQLVYDRRVGSYTLPDGWVIVAAGNRAVDRGHVQAMSGPLKRRFLHLEVRPDLEEWLGWGLGTPTVIPTCSPSTEPRHGVHPLVRAFLRFRPNLLTGDPARVEGECEPCPRTWEYAGSVLYSGLSGDLLLPALTGCVGEGPAAECLAFVRTAAACPDLDEILKGQDHKPPKGEDRPAVSYAITAGLASRYAAPPRALKMSRKQIAERLLDWSLRCLDREFAVTLMRDCARIEAAPVTSTSGFVKWARDTAAYIV